jgi:hypothetical protein
MANDFLEQLGKKRGAARGSEPPPAKPIEEMSPAELRWLALEKPPEEMTLAELRWVTSGEAARALTEEDKDEANGPRLHNFNQLKRTRRKVWK